METSKAEIVRLLRELHGRYSIPRKKAVEALVAIGTPAVIPLIHTLKTGNSDAQAAAAEALDRIGTRVATAAAEHWRTIRRVKV